MARQPEERVVEALGGAEWRVEAFRRDRNVRIARDGVDQVRRHDRRAFPIPGLVRRGREDEVTHDGARRRARREIALRTEQTLRRAGLPFPGVPDISQCVVEAHQTALQTGSESETASRPSSDRRTLNNMLRASFLARIAVAASPSTA